MNELTRQETAEQLLARNFKKATPPVNQLSDPLVDTPMVVTLDQLKPYDHNPRITRNPLFDDIKSSIKERGLDAPPAITRRPGEALFMIRNGGNTRLSILRELWEETQDEQFFKIHCLFKPWKGEITALTGHLAEGELHGKLTFIERALGVVKVREMLFKETGVNYSQRQLAQKLTENGFPISQTLINQMLEAVNYLLPVIPDALYAGMSNRQIIQILRLRKSAKSIWSNHTDLMLGSESYTFDDMFIDVLSMFNSSSQPFDFNQYQDELIGRIAQVLERSYDLISLELNEKEARQLLLETPPQTLIEIDETQLLTKNSSNSQIESKIDEKDILSIPLLNKKPSESAVKVTRSIHPEHSSVPSINAIKEHCTSTHVLQNDQEIEQFVNEHIVCPVEDTQRLQNIQDMVMHLTGEHFPDFKTNVIQSIPVQAGGLHPICDIWHISAHLNNKEQLRVHIGQLVFEIAQEIECASSIELCDESLGFNCVKQNIVTNQAAQVFLTFLMALQQTCAITESLSSFANLLTGRVKISENAVLSDASFVKLMRVLRLVRRFYEQQ